LKTGGIDIGSRYIKFVLIEGKRLINFQREETGHKPLLVCKEIVGRNMPQKLVATGYGRHLLEVHGDVKTVTEIKAVAKGAREIFPDCRTIVDIGGQDTKVISLSKDGAVENFEMNDRCAAGTGRFLEIMAKALGYDSENFGNYCDAGLNGSGVKINSMCTVFAESEVVSLISKGEKREIIARALHESVISRIVSLVKRIDVQDDIVFTGGCAKNISLKKILEERLRRKIHVHDNPHMLAALGAALYAEN